MSSPVHQARRFRVTKYQHNTSGGLRGRAKRAVSAILFLGLLAVVDFGGDVLLVWLCFVRAKDRYSIDSKDESDDSS